jgi:hypothetical protein
MVNAYSQADSSKKLHSHLHIDLEDPLKALKGKRALIYGLDNRQTLIRGQASTIWGGYTGVSFSNKLRLKAGVSVVWLDQNLDTEEEGMRQQSTRWLLTTLGEEFDFLIIGRFRLTAYGQMGLGFDFLRNQTAQNPEAGFEQNPLITLELGSHANYYVWPWAALKVGGGWRGAAPRAQRHLGGLYLKLAVGLDTTFVLRKLHLAKPKEE